jgi:predicted RNA methylase
MRAPDAITKVADDVVADIQASKHPLLPFWVARAVRLIILELDHIRRQLPEHGA